MNLAFIPYFSAIQINLETFSTSICLLILDFWPLLLSTGAVVFYREFHTSEIVVALASVYWQLNLAQQQQEDLYVSQQALQVFFYYLAEKGPGKLSGNFFVGPLPFFVLTRLLGKLERAAGWPKN